MVEMGKESQNLERRKVEIADRYSRDGPPRRDYLTGLNLEDSPITEMDIFLSSTDTHPFQAGMPSVVREWKQNFHPRPPPSFPNNPIPKHAFPPLASYRYPVCRISLAIIPQPSRRFSRMSRRIDLVEMSRNLIYFLVILQGLADTFQNIVPSWRLDGGLWRE